jgi:hypothetical protein
MHTSFRKLALPVAVAAAGLTAAVPLATTAFASPSAKTADPVVYETTLGALNGSGASGTVKISLDGNQATITEHTEGLAATFNDDPFPHVQHIHIGGQGACPMASADKNDDGVVDTPEGMPAYGSVNTTLSTKGDTSAKAATDISIAPSGPSFDYQRTITLSAESVSAIQDGTAVVVVHGLDPSTLSEKAQNEKSPLVPSLPLAATAPALCGVLATTASATAPAPPTTMPAMPPADAMKAQPTFTG